MFFFFKQKTAYEMRISDWSSDVCSSDLLADSLGRYLSNRYAFETRNRIAFSEQGWSNEHWAALAELGITGALFSEKAGGFGGVGFDIGAVFEQLDRKSTRLNSSH